MEELRQLEQRLKGARSQVRALQRTARTTLHVLTDLEEQLDAALAAQPDKEGTANGYSSYRFTQNTSA
jgi:hypothetical protein